MAACRYLAARLLEAWGALDAAERTVFGELGTTTPDRQRSQPTRSSARSSPTASWPSGCLYGVDKNAMAVEMAKLSLWLVTLAKDRPFSFLDHALREGDSLLGVVSQAQVKALHMDPVRGPALKTKLREKAVPIGAAVHRALELRQELEVFRCRRHS